jgi:putative DNA primase/helicase
MELGCLAATNQRKVVIEIKPGYREPPNLFVIPAMDSGNRKSAVVNKVTGAVREWQSEQIEAQKPLIKQARSFRETDSARIAELRKQAAKTAGEKLARLRGELAELERALPEVPAPFLMITGDTTIEKLGPLLVNNDECMSIFDDEGGFLEILAGRYSGGVPNLELVLQCYSGSPVQISRLGRESVTLHSPALTIAISPQAEFLRGLAVRKPEFRTRGLFARCLFLLPPSPLGSRVGDGPPIPDAVENAHDKALRALLSAKRPADGPNVIKLSAEAYAAFRAFSAHIETTMREGGSLEHMRDFAGKMPGSAARIAANLHRGDLALHSDPFGVVLPKATMIRALDCADVFIKYAIAAFDLMGTNEDVTGARRVWEWIKRERKPRFTFHEAHLALRGSFQRSDDLETPIEVLVERYYIIPVQPDPSVPRPRGRPTRPFEVNPKLSEGW